ncbi:cob(I)yrinic acid a,c-diamide adenosyltransferase [Candidatus Wolfebacteria bacterium]|nr:cob(I)yrinic acid a,c-diamide adenosyltransferase [Candidatus Wolfebacteria bacterium]
MLYTRKGDKGDTGAFGGDQKFSKNSTLMESLGTLDELNSLLGICKIKASGFGAEIENRTIKEIIEQIQQNLFIIQAEIAGADKKISREKINDLEKIIDWIEKQLPPIKSFFIPGGGVLSAYLDYARAIIRRTERRMTALSETQTVNAEILAYLNRLSSLFYALARFVNNKNGISEKPPLYQ